jgi:uncharacterized protein YegJ (DUF2314 family)
LREILRSENPRQTLLDVGERIWLAEADPSDVADLSLRRRLKEFIADFEKKSPGDEFAVMVESRTGFASEAHWIAVHKIARGGYGDWTFTGEFAADSKLHPGIRKGEPVAVGKYEVADWRYTAGGETGQGRESGSRP